jgi:hypothetical protein
VIKGILKTFESRIVENVSPSFANHPDILQQRHRKKSESSVITSSFANQPEKRQQQIQPKKPDPTVIAYR